MKKRSIFIIILLTFILLGIAGIFYIKNYFSQERIKALILPALGKRLHGTISIDNLGFSLLKGVELRGIKVQMEEKMAVSSFQCEQAFLKPRLLPLIFGQLVIGEIRLLRPQIFILGGPASITAFPVGILKQKQVVEKKEKETGERKKKKLDLTVEGFKVEKGDIVLINPPVSRFLPPLLQLEEIDFSASNLSFSSSVPFSFSGRIKGIESDPLLIKGLISPREKTGEMNIAWEKIQVQSLNAVLHTADPFLTQGEVDLGIHLSIKEELPLVSDGRIKVTGGRLKRSASEEVKKGGKIDDIDAEMTYRLTVNSGKGVEGKIEKGTLVYQGLEIKEIESAFSWQEKTLNLKRVQGSIERGLFQGNGIVAFDKEERRFSIELKGDRIPVEKILLLSKAEQRRNITGNFAMKCKFIGIVEKTGLRKENLQGNGEIRLQEGKISGVKALELASHLLGYEGLSPLSVSEGKMDFQMEEGKVKTEGWVKSADLEVTYKGNVKPDAKLNISMAIICSPPVFANFKGSGITDLLKDEQGRIIIPLRLKGTWDEPSVRLDTSDLKKMMKNKFQQFYKSFGGEM